MPAAGEEVPIDNIVVGRNYFTYTLFRWPNGRVPYTIDAAFTEKERLVIAQALYELERKSCIKFSDKTGSDQDFLHIYTTQGNGCYASDHYQQGLGQHGVHLSRPGCMVGTTGCLAVRDQSHKPPYFAILEQISSIYLIGHMLGFGFSKIVFLDNNVNHGLPYEVVLMQEEEKPQRTGRC